MTTFGPWLNTNWRHSDGAVHQVRYPLEPAGPPTSMLVRGHGSGESEVIDEMHVTPAGAEYRRGPVPTRTPNRHERRRMKILQRESAEER